jgi:methylmalonyl-CoA/ethylmalonyl-CoA epimerase
MGVKIDHVAIAVGKLDEAVGLFEKILGRPVTRRESVEDFGVETATFDLGGAAIELVEGTNEDSAVRRFVARRGPGIHHLALAVDDLDAAVADLTAKGFRLAGGAHVRGKDGSRVAFLHPGTTGGVLFELVEPAEKKGSGKPGAD